LLKSTENPVPSCLKFRITFIGSRIYVISLSTLEKKRVKIILFSNNKRHPMF